MSVNITIHPLNSGNVPKQKPQWVQFISNAGLSKILEILLFCRGVIRCATDI